MTNSFFFSLKQYNCVQIQHTTLTLSRKCLSSLLLQVLSYIRKNRQYVEDFLKYSYLSTVYLLKSAIILQLNVVNVCKIFLNYYWKIQLQVENFLKYFLIFPFECSTPNPAIRLLDASYIRSPFKIAREGGKKNPFTPLRPRRGTQKMC